MVEVKDGEMERTDSKIDTTTTADIDPIHIESGEREVLYEIGRPDIQKVVEDFCLKKNKRNLAILTCGPALLVAAAQTAAQNVSCDFHKEFSFLKRFYDGATCVAND